MITSFIDWCDANFLKVNTKKSAAIIFDPKGIRDPTPVFVHKQEIAQVQQLSQRLYFLRRLWFYGVDSKIILLFYQSVLESVIKYGLSTWYWNLNVKSKTKIQGILRTAMTLT